MAEIKTAYLFQLVDHNLISWWDIVRKAHLSEFLTRKFFVLLKRVAADLESSFFDDALFQLLFEQNMKDIIAQLERWMKFSENKNLFMFCKGLLFEVEEFSHDMGLLFFCQEREPALLALGGEGL